MKLINKAPGLIVFLSIILYTISGLQAQQFQTPRPSPKASVSQTVGVTEITIHYCRPGVKDRVIWGELVPFNQVWRTGANEVTSITFSDPVKVNGNKLETGTYGIHTVPNKDEWEIIFSGDTKIGGSATFNKEKETLRIKVKPETAEFQERLIFTFVNVTDNSALINLIWEKLKVSFMIETDTQELTLAKARAAIDWSTPMTAATYCLQNNINLEQAKNWINASISINENYWNLRIKAQLLAKEGETNEAVSVMEKSLALGKQLQNKPFDLDNMEKLLNDWKEK
jgi:hypothetical protein